MEEQALAFNLLIDDPIPPADAEGRQQWEQTIAMTKYAFVEAADDLRTLYPDVQLVMNEATHAFITVVGPKDQVHAVKEMLGNHRMKLFTCVEDCSRVDVDLPRAA
jgi:hypothetical protein